MLLALITVFIKLSNGGAMPIQQSALGMFVILIFLCAQAFANPFVEYHLDVLETLLLVCNYVFLFMGLCNFMINEQAPSYAPT